MSEIWTLLYLTACMPDFPSQIFWKVDQFVSIRWPQHQKKDSVYPKNCMEIFLHNVKPKVQKQLIYHREAGIPLVTNSNCWWCTKSEWVMNTYIAASEVQKDTDLCDQWAATWQMKCSVDRYRVMRWISKIINLI